MPGFGRAVGDHALIVVVELGKADPEAGHGEIAGEHAAVDAKTIDGVEHDSGCTLEMVEAIALIDPDPDISVGIDRRGLQVVVLVVVVVLAGLAVAVLLALVAGQPVHAAGTTAGTSISQTPTTV